MTNFKTGDRVALRTTYRGIPASRVDDLPSGLEAGDTATVTRVTLSLTTGADSVLDLDWDRSDMPDNGLNWGAGWFDLVVDESVPGRPVVHFDDENAGRDRSKARAACAEAVSKALKPQHNNILRAAGQGATVDAYALNEAITAAIRSAVTRKGQSTARREQASRFAHVAHIVQAVLENHADNLPAYVEGERSRKIETLEGEISALKTAGEDALRELQRATEALKGEMADHDRAKDDRRRALAEVVRLSKVLEHARSLLDEVGRAHVEGYIEGLRDA
jgi:hypothetical protein